MVEQKVERVGLIGTIVVLALFGGSMYLTSLEAENAYYCPLTEDVAVFHRLSDSAKTGYYLDNEVEESLSCNEGRVYQEWIPLRRYVEEQGLEWQDVFQPSCETEVEVIKVRGEQGEYHCLYNNEGVLETYSKCYKDGIFKAWVGELICPA
ncbi:MAG: hypothetical protein ABIB71_08440 [Candidatus Woesearchaeota archaeon]